MVSISSLLSNDEESKKSSKQLVSLASILDYPTDTPKASTPVSNNAGSTSVNGNGVSGSNDQKPNVTTNIPLHLKPISLESILKPEVSSPQQPIEIVDVDGDEQEKKKPRQKRKVNEENGSKPKRQRKSKPSVVSEKDTKTQPQIKPEPAKSNSSSIQHILNNTEPGASASQLNTPPTTNTNATNPVSSSASKSSSSNEVAKPKTVKRAKKVKKEETKKPEPVKKQEPKVELKDPYTHINRPNPVSKSQDLSHEAKVIVPIKTNRVSKVSDLLNSKSDEEKTERIVVDEENEEDDELEELDEDEVDEDLEEDLDGERDDVLGEEFDKYEENIRKRSEIPLIFDIPLKAKDAKKSSNGNDDESSGQVIVNIMKMAEEKYGFKNIHPNANLSLDILKDGDEYDELMNNEVGEENELLKEFKKNQIKLQKEQEEKLQQQMELNNEEDDKVEKKIKEMIAASNRKIGKYDQNDPFIDDTELYWEETRAVTQDGFFIFWGPLVEESQLNKDPTKYINKAGKIVKKYRSKPGPKSKKEKEMLEKEKKGK